VHPLVRTVTVADTLKPVLALKYKKLGFVANAGTETSGITYQTNKAQKKYKELGYDDFSTKPVETTPSMRLMAEVAASHSAWLGAAAVSAVTGVALLGFAAQRSSEATRLATIV